MNSNTSRALLWVLLTVFLPCISFSQPQTTPGGFTEMGHWTDGPSIGLTKVGNIVYLGNGASVEAINVADPALPVALDRLDLPSSVMDLTEQNGYLYAVTMGGHFAVVDVSDPADLQLVSVIQSGTYGNAVAVDGNFAYWAGYALLVVDIENPAEPQIIAEHGYGAIDVLVKDAHVFVASFARGLVVYALQAPGELLERQVYDFAGNQATSVNTDGNLIYLSTTGVTCVFDFTEPIAPLIQPLAWWSSEPTTCIVAREEMVYASHPWGLGVYSMGDPNCHFSEMGRSASWQMLISENLLYTAHGQEGLVIFDISDSSQPEIVGRHSTGKFLEGLTIHDSRAYVACGYKGMEILDLEDSLQPNFLGEISSSNGSFDDLFSVRYVGVHGDHSLLLGSMGLHVVDSADPANPTSLEATREIDGLFTGATLKPITFGDYWLFQGTDVGWKSLEISSSGEVTFLPFTWPQNLTVNDAIQHNGFIYATAQNNSLWVFDTDPDGELRMRGVTSRPYNARQIHVWGNRIYLVHDRSDISVFDTSNPDQPFLIGQLDQDEWQNEIISIAVDDNFIYAIEAYNGLRLIDFRDPGDPQLVGYFPMGDQPQEVDVHEGLVYVTTRTSGIRILRNDLLSPAIMPDRPSGFSLSAAPNPFNPLTLISFELAQAGEIQVSVFDLHGRFVRQLHHGWLDAGSQEFAWSGRDEDGRMAAAGSYLVRCKAGHHSQTVKVTMAK